MARGDRRSEDASPTLEAGVEVTLRGSGASGDTDGRGAVDEPSTPPTPGGDGSSLATVHGSEVRAGKVDLYAEETMAGDTEPTHGSTAFAPGAMRVQPGDRVGRYMVLEQIGAGAMGEVFAAFDPKLDRKVALKLLHADVTGPLATGDHGRILREAQAMARLTHANTVTVHDVGEHGGRVFVAMELVSGRTLRAWLKERRRWREVVDVFVAAGRGLAAAHDAGLVHRDFKPDNVMIDDEGRVLVMDFGLARASDVDGETDRQADDNPATEDGDPSDPRGAFTVQSPGSSRLSISLTRTGVLTGTPAYMAPEQYRQVTLDARTDQFSFGVALYEALCGERPFTGDTLAALAVQITERPVSSTAGARKLPAWLRRVVFKALEREPDNRWPDMHALVAALEADPSRRRNRMVLGIATVVALGSASAFAWQFVSSREAVCSDSATRLSDVWNDERKAKVAETMRATGLPYANRTVQEVQATVTDWSAQWLDAHRDACEATELHRSQSEEVKDRRMRCLDRHRRQLVGLVEELERVDASTLEQAVGHADALPAVERCGDLEYVGALVLPPDDPVVAATVEGLRGELAHFRVGETSVADPRRADADLAALEELRTRAEALEYPPLLAEVDLRIGKTLLSARKDGGGEQALRRAYFAARRHGVDGVAIDAAIALVGAVGVEQARYRAGLDWAEHASVEVGRSGTKLDEARRLMGVGKIHVQMSEFAEAESTFRRALEIYRAELPPDSLVVMRARRELVSTFLPRGRLDEAQREVEQMRPILVERLGPDHPHVASLDHVLVHVELGRKNYAAARDRAQSLIEFYEKAGLGDDLRVANELQNLGSALVELEKTDQARAAWERALELRQRILGADHPDVADLLVNLASVRDDDSPDAAIADHERAIAIYEAAGATQSHKAAAARVNIGNILFEQGRPEAAVEQFQRAADHFEASIGPTADYAAKARFYQAYTLRVLERYDEAFAIARELHRLLEPTKEPKRWYAITVATLMELELQRGRPKAAAEWLDAAEAVDTESLDDGVRFNMRFAILRVRYENGERAQVRREVRALAREIAATPDAFPKQARDEVAQWLGEHR